MDNQTMKTPNPILSYATNNRDLLIVIFAFIFSVLAYTVHRDFNAIGFTLSATGLLNALLPSKNRPEDERTRYIKYIVGFYSYAICTLGLWAALLLVKSWHIPLDHGRLPFYFLHASLFTYTLMYAVIRRIR